MNAATPSGLVVLHGNRLEDLAHTVADWLGRHPLPPLETETVLVSSKGMAEWLKMELATAHGVCAATSIDLSARFLWRAWRALLGPDAVPQATHQSSPLAKQPLVWRLMQRLPVLATQPGFEPVAAFLQDGHPARRLQLAQRLADLFDQYQVYRSDWLHDWAQGRDRLADLPLPADQGWQPALWRDLLQGLPSTAQEASRAALHQRFMRAVRDPQAVRAAQARGGLPRRITLFGTTHIPQTTLEALAALSAHMPVLMAVPNPCRFHWADIIEGRERFHAARRRHGWRHGRDLSQLSWPASRRHGHPLLAAWGRQSRDFIRQLDAFDDTQAARHRLEVPRVDLFDEAPGTTLLEQVQAAVRDLLPLDEHPHAPIDRHDRSIVFHIAHSAQREVEVLHDQLLQMFAQEPTPTQAPDSSSGARPGRRLAPRDVVVMVPDIQAFAPAIRSVFGQHPPGDPRHIPWGIADLRARHEHPLMLALERLMRAPQERFALSEVRSLLEVPAVAAGLGLKVQDVAPLATWLEGAGVRWGLHEAQRESLGLGAAGEVNTWRFGLRRMLLGYAVGFADGHGEGHRGVEPFGEVAGLEATLAGAADEWLQRLDDWWRQARQPASPAQWGERLRRLISTWFVPQNPTEQALLSRADQALSDWLEACAAAGFEEALDIEVVREGWLQTVDEPGASSRFRAGGVTFCTLLPLRAIPFEVVALLGMNDTAYPRASSRLDFDLMALPGAARAGDRSRRDDDRQLMLDAVLSARRVLYVSWSGRSPRDHHVQPPSVLVGQLRDYLAQGWSPEVVEQRTVEHPLQPFSRRYFEAGSPLFTHAREWWGVYADGVGESRSAGALPDRERVHGAAVPAPASATASPSASESFAHWTITTLAQVLRNPVKAYCREVLQVTFPELHADGSDVETFAPDTLQAWQWRYAVLQAARRAVEWEGRSAAGAAEAAATAGASGAAGSAEPAEAVLIREVARLQRRGEMPLAALGERARAELLDEVRPAWRAWLEARRWPVVELDDRLSGASGADSSDAPALWVDLQAGPIFSGTQKHKPPARVERLVEPWLRVLVHRARGAQVRGLVIGIDGVAHLTPPPVEAARVLVHDLVQACTEALHGDGPWPTALRTGVAFCQTWRASDGASADEALKAARSAYERRPGVDAPGEGEEPCLARMFPEFDDLAAHPRFLDACMRLYGPLLDTLDVGMTTERHGAPISGDGTAGARDE